VPAIALCAASTNHVTHGFTNRPSTSTSTGASMWAASQVALRNDGGRWPKSNSVIHTDVTPYSVSGVESGR
jgi:hypothetical protein